jgi:hypothetical protein
MIAATVGSGSKVKMQKVHVDRDFGTAADVDIGLKKGDKVIDNPPDVLRVGDLVKVGGRMLA